jgi:hypothetical protein
MLTGKDRIYYNIYGRLVKNRIIVLAAEGDGVTDAEKAEFAGDADAALTKAKGENARAPVQGGSQGAGIAAAYRF